MPCLGAAGKPERLILVGSGLRGPAQPHSALNAVLTEAWRAMRMPWLLRRAAFDKHIACFCYTQEAFRQVQRVSSACEKAVPEGGHLAAEDWSRLLAAGTNTP